MDCDITPFRLNDDDFTSDLFSAMDEDTEIPSQAEPAHRPSAPPPPPSVPHQPSDRQLILSGKLNHEWKRTPAHPGLLRFLRDRNGKICINCSTGYLPPKCSHCGPDPKSSKSNHHRPFAIITEYNRLAQEAYDGDNSSRISDLDLNVLRSNFVKLFQKISLDEHRATKICKCTGYFLGEEIGCVVCCANMQNSKYFIDPPSHEDRLFQSSIFISANMGRVIQTLMNHLPVEYLPLNYFNARDLDFCPVTTMEVVANIPTPPPQRVEVPLSTPAFSIFSAGAMDNKTNNMSSEPTLSSMTNSPTIPPPPLPLPTAASMEEDDWFPEEFQIVPCLIQSTAISRSTCSPDEEDDDDNFDDDHDDAEDDHISNEILLDKAFSAAAPAKTTLTTTILTTTTTTTTTEETSSSSTPPVSAVPVPVPAPVPVSSQQSLTKTTTSICTTKIIIDLTMIPSPLPVSVSAVPVPVASSKKRRRRSLTLRQKAELDFTGGGGIYCDDDDAVVQKAKKAKKSTTSSTTAPTANTANATSGRDALSAFSCLVESPWFKKRSVIYPEDPLKFTKIALNFKSSFASFDATWEKKYCHSYLIYGCDDCQHNQLDASPEEITDLWTNRADYNFGPGLVFYECRKSSCSRRRVCLFHAWLSIVNNNSSKTKTKNGSGLLCGAKSHHQHQHKKRQLLL